MDLGSVCVVNFNGVDFFMPDDVQSDFDNYIHLTEAAVAATSGVSESIAPPVAVANPTCAKETEGTHEQVHEQRVVCTALPGHLILSCYSLVLAVGQCAKVRPTPPLSLSLS